MKRDIAIVGGGLAGFSAAIGFASRGFDTVLVAPPAPEDRRSTALFGRSVEFLREHGLWERLEPVVQPLVVMRIMDDTGRFLRAPDAEFRAAEIDLPFFGVNILNRDAMKALQERAGELSDRLEIVHSPLASLETDPSSAILSLDDGTRIEASLVVGADGRHSRVREAAGIGVSRWSYPQSAIVLNFRHERDHQATSLEFHRRTGPFTQVPLPGRRSALVWVEEPERADLIKDLKPDRLSRLVEEHLHSVLGKVEVEDGLQVFPLSGASVRSLTAQRIAVIGEAAHVFPPIGAQGLNLSLREAGGLVEAAAPHREDPGCAKALSRYERNQRLDIHTRTFGVDLLNRSLLAGLLPVQLARTLTFGMLANVPPLRRLVMREGVTPGSGLRAAADHFLPRRPNTVS